MFEKTFFQLDKTFAEAGPEVVDREWVLFQLQLNLSATKAVPAMRRIEAGHEVETLQFVFSALG